MSRGPICLTGLQDSLSGGIPGYLADTFVLFYLRHLRCACPLGHCLSCEVQISQEGYHRNGDTADSLYPWSYFSISGQCLICKLPINRRMKRFCFVRRFFLKRKSFHKERWWNACGLLKERRLCIMGVIGIHMDV